MQRRRLRLQLGWPSYKKKKKKHNSLIKKKSYFLIWSKWWGNNWMHANNAAEEIEALLSKID